MKLRVSRNAAVPAAFAAAAARIFLDLALDGGTIHNGVWIGTLLGMLPTIPYLLCLDATASRRRAGTPVRLLLFIVTALDISRVLSIVTRASGYLALEHVHEQYLLLPLALALLWCTWRNGDAIGYAATLWARVFPALLLLVVVLQIRHYHPAWLLPLLGNGWNEILDAGIRTTGWFAPTAAILLVVDTSDTQEKRPSIAWLALATVIAGLLLVLRSMMTPAGAVGQPWFVRLDALLTNGRAPLYLQLPMIVAFFVGSLHLLACECFAASGLLQRLIPSMDGRLCAAIVVLGCACLSLSGIARPITDGAASWLIAIAMALIVAKVLFERAVKRRKNTCKSGC